MLTAKTELYVATLAVVFLFAIWEKRIRSRVKDEFVPDHKHVSEYGLFDEWAKEAEVERQIRKLSPEARSKLRTIVLLRFLAFATLILEVIVLQR